MAEMFASVPECVIKLTEEISRDGEQGEIETLHRQIAMISENYKEQLF
jgi:hypothetical protein